MAECSRGHVIAYPASGSFCSPQVKLTMPLALMVDGAPEIHSLAGDPHHHLVKVPAIAKERFAGNPDLGLPVNFRL